MEFEFVGHLSEKLSQKEDVGAYGPYKLATYLLSTVESSPKYLVVDVLDGELGRVAAFDSLIGQNVVVTCNVEARQSKKGENSGKWFNSVKAYKIRSTTPEPPKNEQ